MLLKGVSGRESRWFAVALAAPEHMRPPFGRRRGKEQHQRVQGLGFMQRILVKGPGRKLSRSLLLMAPREGTLIFG